MAQAADALAHLTEISNQIEAAVVLDREGTVLAATVDDERAGRMAGAALEGGSVFVVRDEDRLIAATTRAEPTVGLVFYDLKSALRALAEEPAKPKPKPRRAPAKRRPAATTRKKKDDASG